MVFLQEEYSFQTHSSSISSSYQGSIGSNSNLSDLDVRFQARSLGKKLQVPRTAAREHPYDTYGKWQASTATAAPVDISNPYRKSDLEDVTEKKKESTVDG